MPFFKPNPALWVLLFLIPFTATKHLLNLGELNTDLAAQLLIALTLIHTSKQFFSTKLKVITAKEYLPIYFFLFWCLLGGVYNYSQISVNFFKNRTGISKYILQYAVLFFFSFLSIHYLTSKLEKFSIKNIFTFSRKAVLLSFSFVFLFAIIEYGHGIIHLSFFKTLYEFISVIILKGKSQSWALGRLSSITQEPPFLAMYLIFCSPWLFSYLITSQKKTKYIPLVGTLLLTYLSGSRTAFLIITIELFVFLYLSFDFSTFRKRVILLLMYASILSFLAIVFSGNVIFRTTYNKVATIFLSQGQHSDHKVSNISRYGNQKAAINIFLSNPVLGCGLGQQGYYFRSFYTPFQIKNSYEIRDYSDNKKAIWPPGFSMLTRLLAETGVLGCFLFFGFNINLIYKLSQLKKRVKDPVKKVLIITCTTLLVGFLINFFQFDSFRLIGYWYTISVALLLINKVCTTNE